MLVFTDAGAGTVGFVSISSPTQPRDRGTFDLAAAGHPGEPTSAAFVPGGGFVLVAVAGDPEHGLAVVDARRQRLERWLPLPGQPDAVVVSADGRFAAVAIENEESPDAPGELVIVDLVDGDDPESWALRRVALTGLADLVPADPEPEFIDLRGDLAAVTLQENNHVVLVDLPSGEVVDDWSVGMSTHAADIVDDGEIAFDDQIVNSPRHPDAVAWTAAGQLVTANEGEDDLTGGRGFTVFKPDGTEVFDPGADFERQAVRHGHYPDSRSDAKGTEPEGAETGTFGGVDHLFVGSERGNFVSVYILDRRGVPTFRQSCPRTQSPRACWPSNAVACSWPPTRPTGPFRSTASSEVHPTTRRRGSRGHRVGRSLRPSERRRRRHGVRRARRFLRPQPDLLPRHLSRTRSDHR